MVDGYVKSLVLENERVPLQTVMREAPGCCVACGSALTPFGPRLRYSYHRCTRCRTLQLVPMPDKAALDSAYTSAYASAGHIDSDPKTWIAATRPHHEALVQVLKDHAVTGKVLDYGPGWGGLCSLLEANGFACQGVELSEEMAAYCQKQGLSVFHGDIQTLQETDFAALLMSCVFEHLIKHEAWLGQARQLLRPGGLFISLQPTALFAAFMGQVFRLGSKRLPLPALHQTFCPPWHTVLFSLKGMAILAARHGFDLLEIRPAPQGAAPGFTGVAQRMLQAVNWLGWPLLGVRWPLVIGHIFVFQKTDIE